jgi:uncharacterized protein with NRDE domain
MCTIICLLGVHAAYPVIIAANRDERYTRPSTSPEQIPDPVAVVAGRDVVHGGTWFGVNRGGVAVAVADQDGGARDPSRRSRGLLVLDALRYQTLAAARELLAVTRPDHYNAFSLLLTDDAAATIVDGGAARIEQQDLSPGCTVLVSGSSGQSAGLRRARALAALDPARLRALDAAALLTALATLLRSHATDPAVDDALCRHGAESGTVSSFVWLRGIPLGASRFYCAVGAPCRAEYADRSELFADLGAADAR